MGLSPSGRAFPIAYGTRAQKAFLGYVLASHYFGGVPGSWLSGAGTSPQLIRLYTTPALSPDVPSHRAAFSAQRTTLKTLPAEAFDPANLLLGPPQNGSEGLSSSLAQCQVKNFDDKVRLLDVRRLAGPGNETRHEDALLSGENATVEICNLPPRKASKGCTLIYESNIGSWLIFTVPPLMACTTPLRSVYFVYEPVAYAEDPAEFHTARV